MSAAAISAAADDKEFSYIPEFHGAFRTRWEIQSNTGDQRFQVRNARLSLAGKLAPSISYFFQTDLCDRGTMKILDAYGKFDIIKGMYVQAGQFRMPFGVEPFYGPGNYIFSNRSFMGKQVMNYRAVGAKAGYTLPKIPLTIELGVFNPTAIGDHTGWHRAVNYSGKVSYKITGFTISTGYASIKPATVRANLADICVHWQNKNVLIGAEYMYKHYVNSSHKDNHSYVAFVDWHTAVDCGLFNQWSVQARFDGMTDHINMTSQSLEANRNRITVGSTLSFKYKAVHADVRVNYEKYLGYIENGHNPDLVTAEMVIKF